MIKKLPSSYFCTKDTLWISRNLLGKFLVSYVDGAITSGMIIETEAYLGVDDRACHAFGGRRTNRTAVMYLEGGHWYVYLCYGIHSLLNIVTQKAGEPHAILIRAIKPCEGIDIIAKRRQKSQDDKRLTNGPGSVCAALGISTQLSGEKIGENVWIEDRGINIPCDRIKESPRIGVSYAKEHALLPYRFQISEA